MKKLNKIEVAINRAHMAALAVTPPKLAPKVKIVVQYMTLAKQWYVKLVSAANGKLEATTEPNGLQGKNAAKQLEVFTWGYPHAKVEYLIGGVKQKLPIV